MEDLEQNQEIRRKQLMVKRSQLHQEVRNEGIMFLGKISSHVHTDFDRWSKHSYPELIIHFV